MFFHLSVSSVLICYSEVQDQHLKGISMFFHMEHDAIWSKCLLKAQCSQNAIFLCFVIYCTAADETNTGFSKGMCELRQLLGQYVESERRAAKRRVLHTWVQATVNVRKAQDLHQQAFMSRSVAVGDMFNLQCD